MIHVEFTCDPDARIMRGLIARHGDGVHMSPFESAPVIDADARGARFGSEADAESWRRILHAFGSQASNPSRMEPCPHEVDSAIAAREVAP